MLRAELRKTTTTPTAAGLAVAAVVLAGLTTVSTTLSAEGGSLVGAVHEQPAFLLLSVNVALVALVLGMRSFTDEFRHGTIAPTLLVASDRRGVTGAKLAVAGLAGAGLAIVGWAATVGLMLALAPTKGGTVALTAGDGTALAGLAAAAALWAAIGVAVGALIRHQVAAVVTGLVWILVVENMGVGLLRDAGRFLPGQAAHALAGVAPGGTVLEPLAGGLVLVVYAAVLAGLAVVSLRRREVGLAV